MYLFRKIEINDIELVRDYKNKMIEANSSMDGCSGLSSQDDLYSYICRCKDYELGKNIDKGHVPTTQFVCVNKDGIIVGMCSIRHCLNDLLVHVGGHIGYSVHPSYRRQGIATYMLDKMLEICKEMDFKQVLITCLKDNIGSKKTILKCNGIFEDTRYIGNEIIERYWIKL